jgi:hypothetical protein
MHSAAQAAGRRSSTEPATYAARAEAARPVVSASPVGGLPIIDEGMRRWYESCSCCLSDAYPEVKAALDAERDAIAENLSAPASARWRKPTSISGRSRNDQHNTNARHGPSLWDDGRS